MEAQKLKQKKLMGRKGKIKKTIKNVICRPDAVQWPLTNDAERDLLKAVLELYKVRVPEFKKPHWNEIKLIPKSDRPKAPLIKRVNGLLFGISECNNALQAGQCSAVLIEASVNPRSIVQPVIDKCYLSYTPVLCMENLKKLSKIYFGIKTSCMGVKKDCLPDLSSEIKEIFQHHRPEMQLNGIKKIEDNTNTEKVTTIDVDEKNINTQNLTDPYLFRTNKKTRVFDPAGSQLSSEEVNKFSGQHYIKVLEKNVEADVGRDTDRVAYMRMILKKISNNPNRVKTKQ